jgi:hypothetical protein
MEKKMLQPQMRYIKLNTSNYRCKTHWEQGLLPETIMMEFDFKIKANHGALKKFDEKCNGINNIRKFVEKNIGIHRISKVANAIPLKDFTFNFATYNRERELESVTRLYYNRHVKNLKFGFFIVFSYKNESESCPEGRVVSCVDYFSKRFSDGYFKNLDIANYFSLSR